MKVLFCRYNSVCERMLGHALKILNIDTDELFDENLSRNTENNKEYLYQLSAKLNSFEYDFVISIDFLPIISKVCKIYHIPYIGHVVDCPCMPLYSKTLKNTCNYIFMFDYSQYEKFHPVNPGHIFYMPLGCDTEFLSQISSTKEDHENYDCDISFVGSFYTHKCAYNYLPYVPDWVDGYVEGLISAQVNLYGYNLIEDSLTERFCKEFKKHAWNNFPSDYVEDIPGLIADHYIGEKCTERERFITLENISNHFDMNIYTSPDDADVAALLPNLHNKGYAHTYSVMSKVFQCSKINLNMTNRPIKTGIPQRIFDIMGVGGFVLTNYQAEIEQFFDIGKELVVYESQQDLLDKIAYYLSHEEERLEIAANGKKAMSERHRYSARLEDMFQMIKSSN